MPGNRHIFLRAAGPPANTLQTPGNYRTSLGPLEGDCLGLLFFRQLQRMSLRGAKRRGNPYSSLCRVRYWNAKRGNGLPRQCALLLRNDIFISTRQIPVYQAVEQQTDKHIISSTSGANHRIAVGFVPLFLLAICQILCYAVRGIASTPVGGSPRSFSGVIYFFCPQS